MHLDENQADTGLAISTRIQYNQQVSYTISTRIMYDDYDLDYSFTQDYTYDLDEMYEHYIQSYALDTLDADDDYARDNDTYETLAYRHYAWYNIHTYATLEHTRTRRMYSHTLAHKRIVQITLDVVCYEDLELEDLNWRKILELQDDEDLNVSVKEFDIDW